MNSQQYIIDRLEKISEKFHGIKIRYEIRTRTYRKHIIEILPFSFFQNHEYLKLESDLEFDFESSFPNEEIMFISENSLTKINESIFSIGYDSYKIKLDISDLSTPFKQGIFTSKMISSFVDIQLLLTDNPINFEEPYLKYGSINDYALAA